MFLRFAIALVALVSIVSAETATAQTGPETTSAGLARVESRIDRAPLPEESEVQTLIVTVIDLKNRSIKCSVQRSGGVLAPDNSKTKHRSRCSADIKKAEWLLSELLGLGRSALLRRLQTVGPSGIELIAAIDSAPVIRWADYFAARPLMPATPAVAWAGIVVAALFGGWLGLWLGRRVEAAAKHENPPERDWRWTVCGISVGWAATAVTAEMAVGATPATIAWSSQLAVTAAGLLIADRLLRLWASPRLKGQDALPLKRILATRSGWLLAAFATGQMFHMVAGHDPAPAADLLLLLMRSISLVAVAAVLSVLLGAPFRRHGSRLRRFAILTGLSALLLIDWAGGHALIQFMLRGAVGTVICLLFYNLINRIADTLLSEEGGVQDSIMGALGIGPIPGLRQAVWLRLILLLLALVLLLVGLLTAWGFADTARALVADRLIYGFEVAGVRVVPLRFLAAVAILAGFLILARLMRAGAFGRWLDSSRLDPGSREAILRITEYVGLLVAVLVSVSFTGMSLQNTALIAGALSVGLGFGLQALIADIVAGATLLLERSVRPGDWIEVAGSDGVRVQGLVRSVRARATEIHTLDQADILVPNSDLVGQSLTNHTLRNSQGRVVVAVDTDADRDPVDLMEAFRACVGNNPDVVQDGPAAPSVYLRSISGGRLHFEIEVSVADFWRRQTVESALNLAFHGILKTAPGKVSQARKLGAGLK